MSELLATMESGADASASDRLKMVGAVYSALPKDISADGLAASLLMLIIESNRAEAGETKKGDRKQLVKNLKHLLHLLAQQLGASFDFCKLLESLLAYNVKDQAWTLQDEEDRARLIFQCVLLLIPVLPKDARKSARRVFVLPEPEAEVLKKKLTRARKLVLTWFCTDYGPMFGTGGAMNKDDIGARTPDYQSVLGGVDEGKRYPTWLQIARCLLFMESGDSAILQHFFQMGKVVDDNDGTWHEEKYRIDRCYEYGCDFDDEMMWIVLKSASQDDGGIASEMALTLLEHLFECCNIHRRGSLKLSDIMLAWELYSLVCYEPPETVLMQKSGSGVKNQALGLQSDDDANEEEGAGVGATDMVRMNTEDLDLPQ